MDELDSWAWVDNSATANNGPQTVAVGVMDNSTTSSGPDEWGGFFRAMIGQSVNYAMQKDAVTSGLKPSYSASGQPVYMASVQPTAGISKNALMLGAVGLLVVGVLVLKK